MRWALSALKAAIKCFHTIHAENIPLRIIKNPHVEHNLTKEWQKQHQDSELSLMMALSLIHQVVFFLVGKSVAYRIKSYCKEQNKCQPH